MAAKNTYNNLATKARIGYTLNSFLNLKGLISIDLISKNGYTYHVGDTLHFVDTNKKVVKHLFQQSKQSENRVNWLGIILNINAGSKYKKLINSNFHH